MPYKEIAFLEGISVYRQLLVRAFKKEQYYY